METTPEPFSALVLAGGDGTRLQPLTRLIAGRPIPKQYCPIFGTRSLLETTLARIAPLASRERTLVIVNRNHLPLAAAAAPDRPRRERARPAAEPRHGSGPPRRIPEHLVVVRADDLGWTDLGTPEAIERRFALTGLVTPWRAPRLATA